MRRWLKWPLLLMVGALWGIVGYKLAELQIFCRLEGVALYVLIALCESLLWLRHVVLIMDPNLHRSLVEYLEPFPSWGYAVLVGIINVLIMYLVVVGVRRALARRRRRREPGA
ncbi:MAG: hypothetical protein H5U02_14740 [Clostridia bacterium]|nr:hypothetical protein [Clostridia bacterium]